MTDTIRSALYDVCTRGRVSVSRTLGTAFSRPSRPDHRGSCSQIVVTTQMSLKLFGLDHRSTSWSRDAEALLVPQISERWLPADIGANRVLLYYDRDGER